MKHCFDIVEYTQRESERDPYKRIEVVCSNDVEKAQP